MSCFDLNHLWI